MEKGSMLVLAIIATLILSMIAVAGLTVSTTEIQTTQNNQLNKLSYYKAVEGVERAIEDIRNYLDPDVISKIKYGSDNIYGDDENGVEKIFITGSLKDLQAGESQCISKFNGFSPPPLPSLSLGSSTGVSPIIWLVPVTSEVTVGKKRAYSEIETGIYSIIMTGY